MAGLSLALRYRRSQGEERQQIKWFTYAIGLLLVTVSAFTVVLITGIEASIVWAVLFIPLFGGILFVPVAIGIAVLKYRLYDIDLVINRTLVYLPLTAILMGLYLAIIGVFRTFLTGVTGAASDAAVAFTTLIVVALLTPLRLQLQALVDRHLKEAPDATKGLAQVVQEGRSVAQVLDIEQYARRLLDQATSSLNARGTAVYLHQDGAAQPFCACGEPGYAVEVTLPLQHDGVEIGSVSFGPRWSVRPYAQAQRAVLEDAAGVLAQLLTLRGVKT